MDRRPAEQREAVATSADARLGALMAQASPSVRRRLQRKVPPQDAADVEQDVWLRTYLALLDWPQEEDAMPLLQTVLRRAVADYWRRARAQGSLALEDAVGGAPDEGLIQASFAEALLDALSTVPEHYRVVLRARLLDGLSLSAIASRLGLAEGTVKSRLHHGRHLLRDRLGAWRRPQFCQDLAACPLGLGWGLRSLASIDTVAAHLATCPSCLAQWRRLERLSADPALGAEDDTWSLRVVLRVQTDLSVWLEGDIRPRHAAGDGLRVGVGAEVGRLQRLSDDQERNLGPAMAFVAGGGSDPDRLMVETARSGRLRFAHNLAAAGATEIGLLQARGPRHVLHYSNVPMYDRMRHVLSEVLVALPPGAKPGPTAPKPRARATAFDRHWLAFAKDCSGGVEHALSVSFTL